MLDPEGNLRSSEEVVINWNNETVKSFVDPRDGHFRQYFHGELSHTFALHVGYAQAGFWKAQVYDGKSANPYKYEIDIFFLAKEKISLQLTDQVLARLWTLDYVGLAGKNTETELRQVNRRSSS